MTSSGKWFPHLRSVFRYGQRSAHRRQRDFEEFLSATRAVRGGEVENLRAEMSLVEGHGIHFKGLAVVQKSRQLMT